MQAVNTHADFLTIALRVSINFLPETLPRIGEIGLSGPVIAFALFLCITTGARTLWDVICDPKAA